MDFNVVSTIFFLRRTVGLIFTPYATMRKISLERKMGEIVWIYCLTILYFFIGTSVHVWVSGLMGALGLFCLSIFFLSLLPASGTYIQRLKRIIATWSYTLVPTLLWFYSTLFFYYIIPPPRTTSILGISFSIFYIAFSASLFVWKLILIYLCIRFALRVQLYRILYYLLLYFAISLPIWLALYMAGISRIPFV